MSPTVAAARVGSARRWAMLVVSLAAPFALAATPLVPVRGELPAG